MDGFTNTRDIVHCSSPQNPWRGRGSLLDGELNVGRTERESQPSNHVIRHRHQAARYRGV